MKSLLSFAEQIGEEMDQFPIVIPADWLLESGSNDLELKLNDGFVHELTDVTDPLNRVLNHTTASEKVRERVLPPH